MRYKIETKDVYCSHCGKHLVLTPHKRFQVRNNPSMRHFCNHECYGKNKQGSGNPKWRGGSTIADGYVYIYKPEHPLATKHGYVAEHRLVMEQELGRLLTREEVVHHVDKNTRNNQIANLMLFPSEGKHRKIHIKYRTFVNNRISGHKEGIVQYI